MFLGLVGLIIALLGLFGPAILIEAGLAQIGIGIFTTALVPTVGGVITAIKKFMGSNDTEELDRLIPE